jgi:hypothetical protein
VACWHPDLAALQVWRIVLDLHQGYSAPAVPEYCNWWLIVTIEFHFVLVKIAASQDTHWGPLLRAAIDGHH